ncbi:MAG: zinc-binding dehydrogenase, partial [Armatimonadetes bacterium]|nr:zinc-binding dehydrogenase [Armatimonadota bacterium]
MKRVVVGQGRAWLEEEPDPAPEGEWVVVRMVAIPICGSDLHAYHSPEPVREAGHEGVGVVVAADRNTRVRVGQRVALMPGSGCGQCRFCLMGHPLHCFHKPPKEGHFAEYTRSQDWLCLPIPDDLSFEQASLTGCALNPGFGACRRLQASGADTVLVTGLGPVGLGAVVCARARGARVIGVDLEPWRRERALELGAEEVLDGADLDLAMHVRQRTDGTGPSVAIDCTGHPAAEQLCVEVAAVFGRVAFVGENPGTVDLSPSRHFIRKNLMLIGNWACCLADYEAMCDLIRRTPNVDLLISHRFPLSR